MEVTWPRVALFYHPASPLCIQLRDRFVSVAREIRRRSLRVPVEFWAVSCEVHRDACDDLGVNAVPRILAFPAGKIEGIVIPRTDVNGIELEKLVDVLDVVLQDPDAEESFVVKKSEEESTTLNDIEQRANAANDPYQIEIGESDHLREILHPHSDLSDVYADAMMSFLYSLDSATTKDKDGFIMPWSWDRFHAFREWLDLLHWSLPTRDMAKVHNIVNDLRQNVIAIEDRPDEINKILGSHGYYKKKPKWSKSCSEYNKQDQGFKCGFWKLLHIISIGVVEQHKSVLGDLQRVLVSHAGATIRNFIENFGFAENLDEKNCVIESFEECQVELECQKRLGIQPKGFLARFRRRNIPSKADKSWRELSFFLWKIHQECRTNKLSESNESRDASLDVELQYWPPAELCPSCYVSKPTPSLGIDNPHPEDKHFVDQRSGIVWDKEKVFDQLKYEYWPRSLQSPRMVVLDRWDSNEPDMIHHAQQSNQSVNLSMVSVLIFGIVIRFCFRSNRTNQRFASPRKQLYDDFIPAHQGHSKSYIDTTPAQIGQFHRRRKTNTRVRSGYPMSSLLYLDE